MKILILYTNLTDYWMSCLKDSRDRFNNQFLIFRSSPKKVAPFNISSEKDITIYNRENFEFEELMENIENFSPSLIYVSGWTHKNYLKIARHYKKKGRPTIVGMDNHWKGNLKQYLGLLFGRWYLNSIFTDIWIPGSPQYKFAKFLGFDKARIHKGLYCADSKLFSGKTKKVKKLEVLFVGRIVEHKGIPKLISFLNQLILEKKLNIVFHFIGNGPLSSLIPVHNNIKHTKFIPPIELKSALENTGFLILPSTYEAWGVVIHEALLSGTPVISTYQCGAAIDLIIEKFNGWLFDSNSFENLHKIVDDIEQITDEDYSVMSKNAIESAKRISVEDWSNTLQKIGTKKT